MGVVLIAQHLIVRDSSVDETDTHNSNISNSDCIDESSADSIYLVPFRFQP